MARILNTLQLDKAICKIINEAKERVCIITPYITLYNEKYKWSSVLEALENASNRGIHIIIICRSINDDLAQPYISPEHKESLERQQQNQAKALKCIESKIQKSLLHIHYCPFLHAKCYFNENKFIIASLNLTLSSILPKATKKNKNAAMENKELGVLITTIEDEALVQQLLLYINSIVEICSPKLKLVSASGELQRKNMKELEPGEGYCIYCGRLIKYDMDNPICASCKPEIDKNWNPTIRYCHCCGNKGTAKSITANRPLRYRCWKRLYE